MSRTFSPNSRVYHVGVHLLVLVGILALFFVVLTFLILIKRGDWTPLATVLGVTCFSFLLLQILRLEISPDSIIYRNLSGSRAIAFADIQIAYFQVVRTSKTPQGVAAFYIKKNNGSHVKINLRTFSIQASATLFTALEAHGIQIQVPDAWAARRMVQQIRAAQAKLHP